jgi:hypothetical protein
MLVKAIEQGIIHQAPPLPLQPAEALALVARGGVRLQVKMPAPHAFPGHAVARRDGGKADARAPQQRDERRMGALTVAIVEQPESHLSPEKEKGPEDDESSGP